MQVDSFCGLLQEMENKGVSAIVEFDYTANEPDELSLTKGAIISNIKIQSGGWWEGTIASTGQSGMFPDNFVKLLEQHDDNKVVLRDKSSTKNRRCKVIFSYKGNKNDELSLAVGDVIEVYEEVEEGWWRGALNNKIGVFPSNFVELIDSVSPKSEARKSANINIINNNNNNILNKNNRSSLNSSREDLVGDDHDVPTLPPKPIREQCKVLFAYQPVNDDELKLVEGDIITILSKDLPDKGWWKGELRGKVGVFPDNFVTLLPSEPSPARERPERPSVGYKIIPTSKSPNNSYRKDSFGSKDSINDSNLSASLFGNVAAHRRSLESKTMENSNNSLTITSTSSTTTVEKPPRKGLSDSKTPSEIRKSLESLDEKKQAPPPVLSKKPSVPIKKSPSVSTVANNIFSGIKQKVKSVESKLHAHDSMDGVGSSRLSSGAAHIADGNEKGVVGEKIHKKDDSEFDHVERGSFLQDMRQNRAKAPKRRPPTSASSLGGDSTSSPPPNIVSVNGNHSDEKNNDLSPTSTMHHDEELAKPKAREWEKHKAPWMEELKANQAKKTSPNIEPRSPEIHTEDKEKHDMSKSFSSTFVTTASKKDNQSHFEVRANSMDVKSNTYDMFKKDKDKESSSTTQENKTTTTTTKISISSESGNSNNKQEETVVVRPTSVSLRNRSISPISRTSLNTKSLNLSGHDISNHVTNIPPLVAKTSPTGTAPDWMSSRVNELEHRILKLESLVQGQNAIIDDLKRLLRDESEKVRVLKNDLEKYAQCFTQV